MKNKSSYSKVLVTGSVAFDEIMDFPQVFSDFIDPTKLHQLNISFVVDRLEKQIGGIGINIAYNLRLMLGASKDIMLLSSIGRDGDEFIRWLKKNKLSTKGIIVDKKLYTGVGKVMTDKKDNQIWSYYYGAMESAKKINLSKLANRETVLIISATHPDAFLNFQKQAIDLKMDYLYDPGMTLSWIKPQDLKEGVLNCRWLVGNDYEMGRILGIIQMDIIELSKKGIKIITTLGDQGVSYLDEENNLTVPAYKSDKIVDPTGAGDAWRAGFASGIMQGLTVRESLKLGNALASFAVEKYGTVNHKPTRKSVLQRAKTL